MKHESKLLTSDFEIVREVVNQQANLLSAFGFEPCELKWEGSPTLRRYPVFGFLNKRTEMRIDFAFFSAQESFGGGFVVTISKPLNHLLNVKDYLKSHGHEAPARLFRYRASNTDVRSFAQSFFDMFDGLLRKELASIVQGKAWEDTPIDWMGYK